MTAGAQQPISAIAAGYSAVTPPSTLDNGGRPACVIFFPINALGMGRFQLLNLGGLGYGLELRFWVVITIIVSLTLTITLITTNTNRDNNPNCNPDPIPNHYPNPNPNH